jgi:hypothetical protein
MLNAEAAPDYADLTVTDARLLRAEEAQLAATYARRAIEARTSAQRAAAIEWAAAYIDSAWRCRLLGHRIRGELPRASHPHASSAL